MNASRLPKSAPAAEQPPLEAIAGPIALRRAEREWFGVPRRARSRLHAVECGRGPAFRALGEAVWQTDATAEDEAKRRLPEVERARQRLEADLVEQLAGAEKRIRRARLPVEETIMVTPNEPSAPYPPPGEGDPPQPAQVPEPYPPPDEGTPPTPAPDPGQPDE